MSESDKHYQSDARSVKQYAKNIRSDVFQAITLGAIGVAGVASFYDATGQVRFHKLSLFSCNYTKYECHVGTEHIDTELMLGQTQILHDFAQRVFVPAAATDAALCIYFACHVA